MSENERRMAVALGCCTFVPGIPTKRFAREMADRARAEEAGRIDDRPLTEKQAKYLRDAVWKFRKQIHPSVVALTPGRGCVAHLPPDTTREG